MGTPWRCSRIPTLWPRDLEDAASAPIFTPAGKLDDKDDQDPIALGGPKTAGWRRGPEAGPQARVAEDAPGPIEQLGRTPGAQKLHQAVGKANRDG